MQLVQARFRSNGNTEQVAHCDLKAMAPSNPIKAALSKRKEALENPVKMSDMPLLVRLLWKNQNVFSKSWWRDWFVVFKNRHAFFSVFLCHPQHPFTWRERSVLITCVMMFGYALATAAEVALTRAEEIALENVKGDEDATARAYEKYRDFKEKNGPTVTLFGSIFVQAFCAPPAAASKPLATARSLHDHTRKLPMLRR